MSNTISLCMIAKNEAHQIQRCINSIKPFIHQIVVVDTGSTDNTPQVATALGAEVYQFRWQHDFSQARNYSLQQATSSWILFLDCDEEVDQQTAPALVQAVNNSKYDGYWLTFMNIYNQQPCNRFLAFRLFRNNPNFRFECPIHEQILPSVLKNTAMERIGQADVTVYHYGYEDSAVMSKNKIARNIKILNKARQQYGEASFIHFYLGVEYQRLNHYQQALQHYTTALEKSSPDEPYLPPMIKSMAHCLINLEQCDQALQLVEKYLPVYADYTDLVYLQGLLYHQIGQVKQSLACMNKCLEMGPPPARYLSMLGIGDKIPQEFINTVTSSLIERGQHLTKQGLSTQAFAALNTAFNQLKKTPNEALYFQLIAAMKQLKNSG